MGVDVENIKFNYVNVIFRMSQKINLNYELPSYII